MSYQRLAQALLNGRSYFGSALRALQGLPVRHKYCFPIVKLIAEKKIGPILILEIGSWAGASAVSWAKAVRNFHRSGLVTCIDPWRPYFDLKADRSRHYADMDDAAKTGDIFKLFLHNLKAERIDDMVDYRIGDSRLILPSLPPDSYDIIYIDGSHQFEDVLCDIQYAKRLVKSDGVICGDDLELQKFQVDQSEHEQLLRSKQDYSYSTRAGTNYHPGVTEGIALEFQSVSVWDGFWAVKRIGGDWQQIELKNAEDLKVPSHILSGVAAEELKEHGETSLYNLLEIEGRFLAVSKSIGKADVLSERLGERELEPIVLEAVTLDEVRSKAERVESLSSQPTPQLCGEGWGFNFVKMGNGYLAIAKSLGPTDLLIERLGERDLPPVLFRGESLEEVKEKIHGG